MPCRNRFGAEAMIASAPGCDLYVLPEMFSTGFCTSPEGVAEPEPCDSLKWMKDSAEMFSAAIAGSVAVEENGRFFNRFYFVTPDGNSVHYDKRHLFTYGGEHLKFTAGKERKIVEYKGVRILLQVCYDLRFPVWSRNRGDYDMALYVATARTPSNKFALNIAVFSCPSSSAMSEYLLATCPNCSLNSA